MINKIPEWKASVLYGYHTYVRYLPYILVTDVNISSQFLEFYGRVRERKGACLFCMGRDRSGLVVFVTDR
jgi:hypothetical protein